MKVKYVYVLAFLYLALFLFLSINPNNREIWVADNIPTFVIFLILLFTYKKYKFSNLSYTLILIALFINTIGAHYTFEKVPFDLVTNFFGLVRNNFDRMGHFATGLFAYPVAEFIYKNKLVRSKTILFLFPIFFILGIAASYEIVEWLVAVFYKLEIGVAFIGAQGDMWDAQKDMLSDFFGALFVIFIFWIRHKKLLIGKL